VQAPEILLLNGRLISRNFANIIFANSFLFLVYLSYQLLPLHIKALGGGESDIGWVMGVPTLLSVILTPLFGIWVDRFGRKLFILIGQCFVALPCVGFILAGNSFVLFGVYRMMQNVGVAMSFTAAVVLVADISPKDRLAQTLGLYGLSALSIHAIAPTVGELVISIGGFRALFGVTVVYGVAGLLIASRISESAPISKESAQPASLWRVFVVPGFARVLLLSFLVGASLGTVITYLPTYVRSRDIQWISLFYIAYTVTAIFVRVVFGRLADQVGHRRMIFPAYSGLIVAACVLSLAKSQWVFALAGVLQGGSHGFLYPAMNSLALGRAVKENFGKAQSLFGTAFSAGMMFGIFSNGYIADAWGYSRMFATMAVWIAIGLIVFWARERRCPVEEGAQDSRE
jgi:MFS family permease